MSIKDITYKELSLLVEKCNNNIFEVDWYCPICNKTGIIFMLEYSTIGEAFSIIYRNHQIKSENCSGAPCIGEKK